MREHLPARVAEVVRETDDACSFVLDADFSYQPGQFITVRVGTAARCYSLCSSPVTGERPAFTVKRTDGGYASNWLCDNVRAGSSLDILPPAGTFTPGSLDNDLLLFAAGSGITPVMSILKSALATGSGQVVLVYANRDERSVIFGSALRSLAGDRLLVVHHLDSVQGPPTAASLAALARPFAGHEAFICGPDPYMTAVRSALSAAGMPSSRVHVERFVSLEENPFESVPVAADAIPSRITVTLDGQTQTLDWPPGHRMLDVLLDAGLDAPFSCRQGVCGACACQLTEGKVEMAHNEVLEDADLGEGWILACQSTAVTDSVTIEY
ncbi:MAG: ferredoxin--NADP reductase [Streptosporangiaceae bacterium]